MIAERVQHLELRVQTGLESPVALEEEPTIDDHRGVGLGTRDELGLVRHGLDRLGVGGRERDRMALRADGDPLAHPADDLDHVARSAGEFVDLDVVDDRDGVVSALRCPEPEQKLMHGVRAEGDVRLDQGDGHDGIAGDGVDARDRGPDDGVAAGPPLADQEAAERVRVDAEDARLDIVGRSGHVGCSRWNQKYPRGARVRR